MQTELDKAIHQTLAWFAVSGHPLTSFEIYKWLYKPKFKYSLTDIIYCLEKSNWLKSRLQSKDGFYTSSTEPINEMIYRRHERFINACKKYKKINWLAKLFSIAPGVEAIAAVNAMSWWQTTKKSDIDFFIITRPNKIWSARFFLVSPFILLRCRDMFCFSFFASSNALQMKNLALQDGDPYLDYWVKSIVPIFDKGKYFIQFEQENAWVNSHLPNTGLRSPHPYIFKKPFPSFPMPKFIERTLSRLQKNRFPDLIKVIMNKDSRVIVNDNMLKFHTSDRREEFKKTWLASLSS